MSFTGKVSIVTGAGGGIGEAYATALAAQGASVVVADINLEGAERVAAAINGSGGTAIAVRVDISDPVSTDAMAAAAIAAFGGIDHLVNNAAIYGEMALAPLMQVDLDYFRRFMDVNVNGALFCTRSCHQSLVERRGAVVNQSSIAAWQPSGFYSLSKTAINALTASLAAELAPNVRVNAIAPGFIDTPATRAVTPPKMLEAMVKRTPLQRIGEVGDLVGMVLFMLSDAASFMTGQIVAVDGGTITRI